MTININDFDIELNYLQKWKTGKWKLAKAYAYCLADVRDNKYRDLNTPLKKAEAKGRKIELRILKAEIIKEYMFENNYVLDQDSDIQEYELLNK